ncbi:Putative 2EXR domain-containing protein [Colletotrichum destructivum]|uniref:2EXR domain-containing protein n=1 Tax=Colletotrichum destructivum TaxID=34406 RepID=A0AAX4IDX1_9PEZI|nr:Putative 2EXR domain-containing protein [Colletotrichum destructivum]
MASPSSRYLLLSAGLASLELTDETPLQAFHLFGSLPPELRAQIWNLAALAACPPAVVTRVLNKKTISGYQPRGFAVYQRLMLSDDSFDLYRPVPTLLHVCRESRTELLNVTSNRRGLREGQLEVLYLTREHKKQGRGVHINFAVDTLLVYQVPPVPNMKDADHFANLQYLAMQWGLHSSWDSLDGSRAGVRFIRNFPRLRKLTLFVKFVVFNTLPPGEPGRRRREQTQKRHALLAILDDVYHAIDLSIDERPMTDEGGFWKEPEVRVVPKTRAWTPPRVKAWRSLPVTWAEPQRTVVVRIDGQTSLGEPNMDLWECPWHYLHPPGRAR